MFHYMDAALLNMRAMMNKFLHNEDGGVNIVEIVVIVGIAVALAIVFKDEIADLLDTLLGAIKTNAGKAVETIAAGE